MVVEKDRISLDTNIGISFLITKNYSKLDKTLLKGQAILLFSEELLNEFVEVVKRPGLKKFFSQNDIRDIMSTINQCAAFIKVTSLYAVCRDPKDNFLLALAMDGNATHLITGDNDLLEIRKFGKTRNLTISQYLQGKIHA